MQEITRKRSRRNTRLTRADKQAIRLPSLRQPSYGYPSPTN